MTTSNFEIAKYWSEREPKFVIDINEPACFACGYYEKDWRNWNGTKLERAHIIAASIGGKIEPGNLLLLCPLCHAQAPMTDIPEIMLNWTREREPYLCCVFRKLHESMQRAGIQDDDMESFDALDQDCFENYIKHRKLDFHPIARRLDAASYDGVAALLKDYLAVRHIFRVRALRVAGASWAEIVKHTGLGLASCQRFTQLASDLSVNQV